VRDAFQTLPPGGLNVELIAGEEALGAIADPWRRLAAARGNAFVTPEWYLAALNTVHSGSRPAVVVVRDRGEVRGLLPMLALESGRAPRSASFPGTRFGDLYHPVAERGDDELVATTAAPVLAEHLGARCRLDLGRVDAQSSWWRELARAWPARMAAVPHPEEALPFIALNGSSWEDYLAGRSRQFRNQVGRKMRGLQRGHQVRVRQSVAGEEVLGDFGTLFDLHEARWRGRQVVSSIADPAGREFHRRFVVDAHRRGWLRLYLLEVDEVAVAGWYGWRVGDRFSYYQAGFDPAWARHSVGFLLLAETVREAIAEGAAEYDLLLGDEAFKARFATGKRLGRSVLLAPRVSRPRMSATARAWVARARDRIATDRRLAPSSSRAA
jgi:CelD/BcsL family acetyltransferase involved in cellulose biosynthesis